MGAKILTQPALPAQLLRFGLAFVLLYAGISSLVTPSDWVGYIPSFIADIIDADLFVRLFAIFQLALALWLVMGWYTYIAGLVSIGMFAGILLGNLALIEITFRDIVAVFASAALVSLTWPKK